MKRSRSRGAARLTSPMGFALWISLAAFRQSLSVTRTRTGSLRSAGGSWRAYLVRRRNRLGTLARAWDRIADERKAWLLKQRHVDSLNKSLFGASKRREAAGSGGTLATDRRPGSFSKWT